MTRIRRDLWVCAAAQALGLALIGWHFRHALNADGVAYLRIGSYWADGQWNLAVSGYWGPLLTWIVALLLKLGLPLLVAGRVAMGISAMVFFWGCIAVYGTFNLPEKWIRRGAWAAALAGIYWSVQAITPDLLAGGLIALAAGQVLRPDWLESNRTRGKAGALWGAAYLAKAIALPLGFLFIVLTALSSVDRGRRVRGAVWTLLVFGLVAAPWILTLSLKYGKPTCSTSARISYDVAGPPDLDRYHPTTRTFHQPAPGRITSWEEPSQMPYQNWSPFENARYASYAVRHGLQNAATAVWLLTTLNLLWPVLLAGWLVGLRRKGRGWTRPLALPGLLAVLYLPFLVGFTDQRYFYATFPFLFAASVLCFSDGAGPRGKLSIKTSPIWEWVVMGAVLVPLALVAWFVGDSTRQAGEWAYDLAGRVEAAHVAGPVAGSGALPGGRTGLYLAFYLNQPWYGDELQPTPASVKESGARLFVTDRGSALATALSRQPGIHRLDDTLFRNAEEATNFPVMVFSLDSR